MMEHTTMSDPTNPNATAQDSQAQSESVPDTVVPPQPQPEPTGSAPTGMWGTYEELSLKYQQTLSALHDEADARAVAAGAANTATIELNNLHAQLTEANTKIGQLTEQAEKFERLSAELEVIKTENNRLKALSTAAPSDITGVALHDVVSQKLHRGESLTVGESAMLLDVIVSYGVLVVNHAKLEQLLASAYGDFTAATQALSVASGSIKFVHGGVPASINVNPQQLRALRDKFVKDMQTNNDISKIAAGVIEIGMRAFV